MRLITWFIVILAALNVAFLAGLPLLAKSTAERLDFPRPAELPSPTQPPDLREEPLTPISELHEALRLPRVDTSLTDPHSRAAIAAYQEGNYEEAFEEAVLSLDPAPLEENELYRTLTTAGPIRSQTAIQKPNGRIALESVDRVLQPIVREADPEETAARLNNAAAMLILYEYSVDEPLPDNPFNVPADPWVARELAYQAADLQPASCSVLLNLTLFDRMERGPSYFSATLGGATEWDLNHASLTVWTDYYPPEGCDDPALLYYRAQSAGGTPFDPIITARVLEDSLRLADRLQANPDWAGLAHSVKGDAYYWAGIYAIERTETPRPFTADSYFKEALREYDAALALQPDDPAIRHGKALVFLELGKAARREDVDEESLNRAIEEAEAALESAPGAPRIQQTLVEAYEEKGDYATAAKLNRGFLSEEQTVSAPPLTLVPYSAISHGADLYSELGVVRPSPGGAGGVLTDDEVITPFTPRPYEVSFAPYTPEGLKQYLSELRHYRLLRDSLLSGDHAALNSSLQRSPQEVRQNESTLLLSAIAQLLNQPEDAVTPTTPQTQAAIDDFLENSFNPGVNLSASSIYSQPEWQGNDNFYREAGNFFRQHKQYESAIRVYSIWRVELEHQRAEKERLAEAESLLGEAHFLRGDEEGALAAFQRAAQLRPDFPPYVVRQAFIHEEMERYEVAEDLYRRALDDMRRPARWMHPALLESILQPQYFYFPDNYYAAKHLGDVLLRQAEVVEQTKDENSREVKDVYAEAARAYHDAVMAHLSGQATGFSGVGDVPSAAAINNLGISLLKAGDHERSVEVLETLVLPSASQTRSEEEDFKVLSALAGPSGVPDAWENEYNPGLYIVEPPTPDKDNPIFHLNLGWAYELNGEPEKAREHYLAALEGDPTFHPALNDLGVLAAKQGKVEEAKSYFEAALEARPDYSHASHNMGVALLRSGPQNFLAAQHYFARAVRDDPSLSIAGHDYIFDNGIYFIDLSLSGRVPPDWHFARDAQNGMGVVSLLALALILGRIAFGYAGTWVWETVVEKFFSRAGRLGATTRLPRLLARLRDGTLRFMNFGVASSSGGWWTTPLALLISAPAIVAVMGWSLLGENSESKSLMLGTLLYLALVSLLVHHAGHALAALYFRMRVRETPWPAGILQALALVIVGGPAIAPMPANILEKAQQGRNRERSIIYLAGPMASIIFAALLYGLFFFGHVPLLRLGAVLNLAIAAASLILLPPLDGAMVSKGRHARLLFWAGAITAALAVLVYFDDQLYCLQSPGEFCWNLPL